MGTTQYGECARHYPATSDYKYIAYAYKSGDWGSGTTTHEISGSYQQGNKSYSFYFGSVDVVYASFDWTNRVNVAKGISSLKNAPPPDTLSFIIYDAPYKYQPLCVYAFCSDYYVGSTKYYKTVIANWDEDIELGYYNSQNTLIYLFPIYIRYFTVQFNDPDGNILSTVDVRVDESATPPDYTPPEGYVFTSWDGSYTEVTADAIVTASIRAVNYSIDFNGNGNTGGTTASQAFTYGIAQNLNTNGYYKNVTVTFNFGLSGQANTVTSVSCPFTGWATTANGGVVYTNGSQVSDLCTTDGGGLTLYAVWGGGSVYLPAPATYPTGYKFLGWYWSPTEDSWFGAGNTTRTDITESIIVYAHWSPIIYTVRFDQNGGCGTMTDMSCDYNTSYSLRANGFTRTGYTFKGWATSLTGTVTYYEQAPFINLTAIDGYIYTLYAVWSANTYTVTFVPGTNHSVSPTTKGVTYGATYDTLPTPTSTDAGEVFAGWYTATTGGTQITANSLVSTASNHTLYARFAVGTYTVVFNSNSGVGTMGNESFSFGETKALSTNAFTKTHAQYGYAYDFLGWSKDANASAATYSDGQPVVNLASAANEVVTLYAIWRAKTKITVQSNDTDLGSVSASTGFYSVGSNVTVTATVIDASQAAFSGWYVDSTRKSTSAQYTLEVPANDTVYEARFRSTVHYVQIPIVSSTSGTVSVTVGGTKVDASSRITCHEGDTIGLQMVPAYNYEAQKWTVDDTDYTGSDCSFSVTADSATTITCTPTFVERAKYGLTIRTSGGGAGSATLSVSDSYGNTWASESAGADIITNVYVGLKYIATVSLPNDDPNLEFEGWTKDGASVTTQKTYSFTQSTAADIVLVAKVRSKLHLLNISRNPNVAPFYGYIEGSLGDAALESLTNVSVAEGTEVTVKATPSVLRSFARWEIDGLDNSINATNTFRITKDMPSTIAAVAVFESKSRSNLSVTKENGSLGTIDVSYEDVLDPDTGKAGKTVVYLAKDSEGNVYNYLYAGTNYTCVATLLENKSVITGNALTSFSGWYVLDGTNWVKKTGSLTYTLSNDATAKAVFAYNTLYEGTLSVGDGSGTLSWAESAKPDVAATEYEGPKWLSGRTVTLVATPATGYAFSSWNIKIDGVPQAATSKATYSFSPTGNFEVEASFSLKKCPVTLTVDAASEIASDGVSATVNGKVSDATALAALTYGSVVTYKAKTKAGYSFNGWYSNGEKLSADATYEAAPLTDEVTIVAKYAATVGVAVLTSDTAVGTISVTATFDAEGNPIDFPSGSAEASCTVVLGEKCGIRALATSGAFGAWYLASDTNYTTPLEYVSEDSFIVLDNTNLVARLINANDYTYIALFNDWKDASERDDTVTLGILSMTKGEVIDAETFNVGLTNAGYAGAAITGAYVYYRFLGVQRSELTALDNSGRTFSGWSYQPLLSGAFPSPISYSTESVAAVSTTTHTLFTAYWGTPKPVRIEVSFCDDSRGHGTLLMNGETANRVLTDNGIVDEIMQGEEIKIGANVTNGYMFAGWYGDKAGDSASLISADQSYTFTAESPRVFYAKFVEDRNSIYKWEGSEVLKTLRWKSKTYVSSRPFDPSCVRIDADGYSVGLKVEMFSSPDQSAKAVATKEVEVTSQDARRLKRGRAEKYCALTLEADNEVDALVIGTNMEGLAQ